MCTYLSKTTQNDLLSCIKDFIQSELVNDIQNQTEGPVFGISADEVTDVSNWEQLGIVVRYVRNCQAIEKLLEFAHCDDIKGASIAEFINNALNNAGLNPQMCRAQTYDEPVTWQARWVERHTSFTDSSQLYESILRCLESISLNNDLNNISDPH